MFSRAVSEWHSELEVQMIFTRFDKKANSIALTFDISSTKNFLCIQSRLMIGNILLTELSVSSHLNVCISDIQIRDFELLWVIHHSKQVRTVYLVAFQPLTSSLFIPSSDLFFFNVPCHLKTPDIHPSFIYNRACRYSSSIKSR